MLLAFYLGGVAAIFLATLGRRDGSVGFCAGCALLWPIGVVVGVMAR